MAHLTVNNPNGTTKLNAITVKLYNKKGIVTIPKKEYQNDSLQITNINIVFNAVKEGLINPSLLKGSRIVSTTSISKSLAFDYNE